MQPRTNVKQCNTFRQVLSLTFTQLNNGLQKARLPSFSGLSVIILWNTWTIFYTIKITSAKRISVTFILHLSYYHSKHSYDIGQWFASISSLLILFKLCFNWTKLSQWACKTNKNIAVKDCLNPSAWMVWNKIYIIMHQRYWTHWPT